MQSYYLKQLFKCLVFQDTGSCIRRDLSYITSSSIFDCFVLRNTKFNDLTWNCKGMEGREGGRKKREGHKKMPLASMSSLKKHLCIPLNQENGSSFLS